MKQIPLRQLAGYWQADDEASWPLDLRTGLGKDQGTRPSWVTLPVAAPKLVLN